MHVVPDVMKDVQSAAALMLPSDAQVLLDPCKSISA